MTTATVIRTDQEIQKDVIAELRWEQGVDAGEIGVAVKDGVVTLIRQGRHLSQEMEGRGGRTSSNWSYGGSQRHRGTHDRGAYRYRHRSRRGPRAYVGCELACREDSRDGRQRLGNPEG